MSVRDELSELLGATVGLLDSYIGRPLNSDEREPLVSLLNQCQERVDVLRKAEGGHICSIHHFACTGGTIICRAIAAQPNVVCLSEVDPLSSLAAGAKKFAPTDIIGLAQAGARPAPSKVVQEMFLETLSVLYRHAASAGRRLILRDHTHSHFCTNVDIDSRPTFRDLLMQRFSVRSVVTVRHPVDSFLSLKLMGWVHFEPETLEEYSARYIRFLGGYSDVRVFRYEEFTDLPDEQAQSISRALGLAYNPFWRDILPIIALTGNSGRKGDEIFPRVRREVPIEIVKEAAQSDSYAALCARLGYNSDPTAPPFA